MAIEILSDETRIARAKQRGKRMIGPLEIGHCEHTRLFSYRWTWPIDSTPEDGDVEFVKHGCTKCNREE